MLKFIHIPKTGGTTTIQYQRGSSNILSGMKDLGHCLISHNHDTANPIYKDHDKERAMSSIVHIDNCEGSVFTNVRNPFSFFVSYASHAGGWNPKYYSPNHYDFKNIEKGFEYLLKTMADREYEWPSRKFIYFQMFCTDGTLMPHWLNRTETLRDDLEQLAKYYEVIYYADKPDLRSGGHKDYRTYYTDELIDLVYKTWYRELDLFNYSFEPLTTNSDKMHHLLTEGERNIKYFLTEDKLIL